MPTRNARVDLKTGAIGTGLALGTGWAWILPTGNSVEAGSAYSSLMASAAGVSPALW